MSAADPSPPRILHLWNNYYADLFDYSHTLCLKYGVPSEIICRWFYRTPRQTVPPQTDFVHEYDSDSGSSSSIIERVKRRSRMVLDDRRFGRLVARHLRTFKPDVLHIHYGLTGALLLKTASLPDMPFVVSFYGVDASAALYDLRTVKLYQDLFRRNLIAHVLCADVADRLVALGCPSDRIAVINLPARVEEFGHVGTKPGDHTRFLIPARFVEKKGHKVLLKAFARLRQAGSNATLTCWGYGDPSGITTQADALGLSGCVTVVDNRFAGAFTEMYTRVLETHDVVVAPSVSADDGDDEGGPALTVVMAQAAAKPVIVSDFPGAELSVANEVEGLVVRQGDVEALHGALARLDGKEACWRSMGNAGRLRVLTDFSQAAFWEKLQSLYGRLAASNNRFPTPIMRLRRERG